MNSFFSIHNIFCYLCLNLNHIKLMSYRPLADVMIKVHGRYTRCLILNRRNSKKQDPNVNCKRVDDKRLLSVERKTGADARIQR